jgi:hypothetical protein
LPSLFNPFDPFVIRIPNLFEPARAAVAVPFSGEPHKHQLL